MFLIVTAVVSGVDQEDAVNGGILESTTMMTWRRQEARLQRVPRALTFNGGFHGLIDPLTVLWTQQKFDAWTPLTIRQSALGRGSARWHNRLQRSNAESVRIRTMSKCRVVCALLMSLPLAAGAQSPASSFDRGSSKQAWQDPGLPAVLAKCKSPPKKFAIGAGDAASTQASAAAPPEPPVPAASTPIPGVIAGDQHWKVVWQWEGNNVDGPISDQNGTLLVANNDASNVMRFDPATGLASVVYTDTNTGGAVSRSKSGSLFLAARGLHAGIVQLEPQRKMFASQFRGEPIECTGGVLNDLAADNRGGVYVTITGAGLFYADAKGAMAQYGDQMTAANGIILSKDEKTLYVTNGAVLMAFDVQGDGSLTNQREFGKLRGGQGGDGSSIDSQGRVYVATGKSVDVFSPKGEFLGSIPGPDGLHGTAFGGPGKKTLYGIVFYGTWGGPSARNRIIAIPTLTEGYAGRAK